MARMIGLVWMHDRRIGSNAGLAVRIMRKRRWARRETTDIFLS